MRRIAKVDANQAEIIAALRAYGAFVQPLHTVGNGCPDIFGGFKGQTFVMEIKSGPKEKLTPDQLKWHANWTGGTLAVVSDVESALRLLKVMEA